MKTLVIYPGVLFFAMAVHAQSSATNIKMMPDISVACRLRIQNATRLNDDACLVRGSIDTNMDSIETESLRKNMARFGSLHEEKPSGAVAGVLCAVGGVFRVFEVIGAIFGGHDDESVSSFSTFEESSRPSRERGVQR